MQLTIKSGAGAGRTFPVDGTEFTIGREAGVDLVLADGKASRRHAALRLLPDGRATLYDLGSSNGTYVNGQRIQSVLLQGGEQIQIGDTILVADGARQPVPAGAGPAAPQQAPPQPVPIQPTPPTEPLTPATPPQQQPQEQQPAAAFAAPSPQPVVRPSRTQSAIQRIMLQRAVNRATIIGIVAIVLVIALGALAALGVFSGSKGLTNAQIVDHIRPSTLLVVNDQGSNASRGTGWVWDAKRGIIITNAHVVDQGRNYSVSSGDNLSIAQNANGVAVSGGKSAKLLGQANCEDIGVLQVSDTAGLKNMPRGSQKSLKVGDHAVAVGYPGTQNTSAGTLGSFGQAQLTATSGDVSTVQTTFAPVDSGGQQFGPYQNVILTDTVINHGNSGGPLLDDNAHIVGMNSAGATGTDIAGQNYAVSIDRINEMVPKIMSGQNVCP